MKSKSKRAQGNDKPKRSRSAAARRRAALRALRAESELHLREQIRRLLALPMEERTHFLRVRLPGGGTAL
jgi:hypothetical protein